MVGGLRIFDCSLILIPLFILIDIRLLDLEMLAMFIMYILAHVRLIIKIKRTHLIRGFLFVIKNLA